MKQTLVCLSVLLLVLTSGAIARAQIPPPPTPTPDPHTYSDPGMNFTAPADAHLLARASNATPDVLTEDLQPIAAWVIDPGKEDARTISIAMEAYDGPPDQWEAQFESQTHSSQDGTLIRNKTPMTLLNGMPAYFVEVAYGSGFDAKKEYAVVWADGQRGVVLAETSRLGDSSEEEAKRFLKQVTAVRYPMNQP
jgi:hypothetical protein